MANDKVFSARADEQTIERLNQLAEQSGMKKADILPALLDAWESNRIREALPGRATEIDNLHNLLTQVERAYTASLELNVNAENRIREEYAVRIQSNEEAVQALRAQLDKAKEQCEVSKAAAGQAEAQSAERGEELRRMQETLETVRESLKNANAAKDSMEKRVIELESKLASLPELQKQAAEAAERIAQLEASIADERLRHKTELLEVREKAADAREADREAMQKKFDDAMDRAEKRHADEMERLARHVEAEKEQQEKSKAKK